MSKKWRIYIVGHNSIHDETIKCDKSFNNDNYCFLNVGSKEELLNSCEYKVINQREFPTYIDMGKQWAESEGLYNLWRSKTFTDLDYIGSIHYDVKLELDKKFVIGSKHNITQRINRYISNRERGHISFATYTTEYDFGQRVMLDPRYPNQVTGDGRNCYYKIIDDYNTFFNTDFTVEDFLKVRKVNLCSCFLIDVEGFEKMMSFFDFVVKGRSLDAYNTDLANRMQGAMAERYFGLFMLFEYPRMKDLNLLHMYDAGWK